MQPFPDLIVSLNFIYNQWKPSCVVPLLIPFHREHPVLFYLSEWYCNVMGRLVGTALTAIACVTFFCANLHLENYIAAENRNCDMVRFYGSTKSIDVQLVRKNVRKFRLGCEQLLERYTVLNRALSSILTLILLTDLSTYLIDLSMIFDPVTSIPSGFNPELYYEVTGFLADAMIIYASSRSTELVTWPFITLFIVKFDRYSTP